MSGEDDAKGPKFSVYDEATGREVTARIVEVNATVLLPEVDIPVRGAMKLGGETFAGTLKMESAADFAPWLRERKDGTLGARDREVTIRALTRIPRELPRLVTLRSQRPGERPSSTRQRWRCSGGDFRRRADALRACVPEHFAGWQLEGVQLYAIEGWPEPKADFRMTGVGEVMSWT